MEAMLAECQAALAEREHELAAVRQQQAATSEVLATISRSPSVVQGVLDKLVESAG